MATTATQPVKGDTKDAKNAKGAVPQVTNSAPSTETAPAAPVAPVKKEVPVHPLVGNTDPKIYPFPKLPDDYWKGTSTGGSFRYLTRDDFATDVAFYEYRVQAAERDLAKIKVKLDEARQLEALPPDQRANASGAAKTLGRLSGMKDQLAAIAKARGISVQELFASFIDAPAPK